MSNSTYKRASDNAEVEEDDEIDDLDEFEDVTPVRKTPVPSRPKRQVAARVEEEEETVGLFSTPARSVTLIAALGLVVVLFAMVIWLLTSRAPSPTNPTSSDGGVEVSVITKANLGREGEAPATGKLAPDFEWNDAVTGKPMRLSTLGKPVFVNFWGTWCPPCRAEMPEMQRLYNTYKDKVEFIGVSMMGRGDEPSVVKAFVHSPPNGTPPIPYTWRFVHDGDYSVATRYLISAVPSSYFIGTDGVIKAVHVGGMSGSQMEAYLQQLK